MANTKEQQLAIDMEGSNIIVSAGAGSGKTAVLTQRVIRKILDGVDVDKLLVLTFTNEAASEMKSRIRDAIIKNNLDNQLGLLDSAYITTFDSFALSIVKKYYYVLNISKNIGIVDSNIITIYKYKVINEIFEDMYGNSDFDKLISDFCLKDDKSMQEDIIKLSNKLELLLDKKKYIDSYFDKYNDDTFFDKMIIRYENIIKRKIEELKCLVEEFNSYINDNLSKKLDEYLKILFSGNNYQEFVLFRNITMPRFVGVDEDGKELRDEIKKKIEELKKLLRFDSVLEIKETIKSTNKYIEVILNIIEKMDSLVIDYKNKYGIYEFNDIAHMAIDVVKNNKNIQEELKNYFNEIMVDEYQDTSSIQEEFINLISNDNVYMVGDIKQSIYRFRNANPYIFQDKYNRYGNNDGGRKIDLLKNFRSRKETLNNINEIFNLIMDDEIGNADYIKSHNMVYGNTCYDVEDTGHDNNLEIYNYDISDNEYSKEEKELFIISEDINKKIKDNYQVFDKKTGKLRCIKYSDICIITDRNKYMDKYKKILEFNNIPSVIYMDLVLTNDTSILVLKNLFELVMLINNRGDNNKIKYCFTSVARSFLFSYDDNDIYNIINTKKIYNDIIIEKCKNIDILEPLPVIINNILEEFNVYEKLTNLHNIEEDLVRISNLIDISNSLNALGYNIEDFVNYLDDVIKNGLDVKYSINTGQADAVKIMNIHKSKGLEFSLCYFTGMHNKFTIRDISERILISDDTGIILPYIDSDNNICNTILKDIYVDNFFLEEVSEKIRLFYVALTRCREKMIIVTSLSENRNGYSKIVPSSKRIKYMSFLDILNSIIIIDKYVVSKTANYTHDYDYIKLKKLELDKCDIVVDKKKINIEYSIMDNKHFSKGNNKLFDKNSIKNMEYGTKMHELLEYTNIRNSNSIYAKKLLEKIDSNYIHEYHEYEFMYEKEDTTYHGIIDLILEYEDYINIIDYKLKDITDREYEKQLKGYKEYIEMITGKKSYTYLYSIKDNELLEIKD